MTNRPRLPYAPTETHSGPWCVSDPLALKEESDNDVFYPYFTPHGITITATPTTFIITDLMPENSNSPAAVIMEATIGPDDVWHGSLWFLDEPCSTPGMTSLALLVHRTVDPPDYHGKVTYHGTEGWTNFIRWIYHFSMLWVAGTRW